LVLLVEVVKEEEPLDLAKDFSGVPPEVGAAEVPASSLGSIDNSNLASSLRALVVYHRGVLFIGF
jgi:hypothetical protein